MIWIYVIIIFMFIMMALMFVVLFFAFWLMFIFFFFLFFGTDRINSNIWFRIMFQCTFQNLNIYPIKFVITPNSAKAINLIRTKLKIFCLSNSLSKCGIKNIFFNSFSLRRSIPFLSC
jgi:hypothetical protein